MNTIYEELKQLTAIPAVSGHEDKMIREVYNRLKMLSPVVSIDRLGNIIATFAGRNQEEPSVIVFAHVDEVGMMVKKIEDNGFLRFERIGGLPAKSLLGQLVDVFTTDEQKPITGIIGTTSHHLTPEEKKYLVPQISEMYIDVGCNSKEEVFEYGINIGSIITYHHNFIKRNNYVSSKALDNRIGVYLLLRLSEYLNQNPPIANVHIVFSVQEEFNVRGPLPVFEKLKPDSAICIDITPACDTPDLDYNSIRLGGGPAITQLNFHGRGTLGGIIPNPLLRQFIESIAEEIHIPYQREVIVGVITDDAFTQLSGVEGVATAHISIPLRYTHSPVETANIQDIEYASLLLNETISRYSKKVSINRGI
jgi:putative aminopeptidase FrvX